MIAKPIGNDPHLLIIGTKVELTTGILIVRHIAPATKCQERQIDRTTTPAVIHDRSIKNDHGQGRVNDPQKKVAQAHKP